MSKANNKVLRFCPNFNSVAKSRGSYIPDLTLPPEDDTRPIGIWGAGVQWTPLTKSEAPTEPTGETEAQRLPEKSSQSNLLNYADG